MAFVLVDDLTRVEITDPDHEPTVLSVDGHAVEIDLSDDSRALLHQALAAYFTAGRAPTASSPGDPEFEVQRPAAPMREFVLAPAEQPSVAADPPVVSDAEIRKWARQHGVDCPAREQVQASVRRLYADSAGGPPSKAAGVPS